MKLVRYDSAGEIRPGLWLADYFGPALHGILDVRAQGFDIDDYDEHFFTHGGLARLRLMPLEGGRKVLRAGGVRLAPPLPAPRQILCLGKNYAEHAAEFDAQVPTQPIVFAKAPGSWSGPADPVVIPPGWNEVDAEAELALVIGRPCREVAEADALDCIAGYLAVNDVTERRAQREGLQWFMGKSFDTFCPAGPWMVTADEIADPHALRVCSRLNGTVLQDGNTRDMIFRIPRIIAHITKTMTLRPGDVISTGTPAGVGFARKPPVLLRPGDVIEVEVESVGALRNPVVGEGSK